jgi:hypothetical protein
MVHGKLCAFKAAVNVPSVSLRYKFVRELLMMTTNVIFVNGSVPTPYSIGKLLLLLVLCDA